MSTPHGERKHSKFSASGAERWFACPGSVALSEGLPDKESRYAMEGTKAHEVLEAVLKRHRVTNVPREMLMHARNAASAIVGVWGEAQSHADTELLVETRIHLDFIHPEMFGTFDGAVVEHFGTLNVFDYKYGKYTVSPIGNLQMLFYGIGLAHKFDWNFKRARLWIIQPRATGYDGPTFSELSILELKAHVDDFERAVERVEKSPTTYVEGKWCFFCKARGICPLKTEGRNTKAMSVFGALK